MSAIHRVTMDTFAIKRVELGLFTRTSISMAVTVSLKVKKEGQGGISFTTGGRAILTAKMWDVACTFSSSFGHCGEVARYAFFPIAGQCVCRSIPPIIKTDLPHLDPKFSLA